MSAEAATPSAASRPTIADAAARLARNPLYAGLQLRATAIDDGELEIRLPLSARASVAGGDLDSALAVLMSACAALVAELQLGQGWTLADLRRDTHALRAVGDLLAHAHLIKRGRQFSRLQIDIRDADAQRIASGSALLVSGRPASRH